MILRDLSDPCFGLQPNTDYASTDLAVGQEVNAFSPPKFSLTKSYPRDKHHFGLSRDASVQFVNLSRDVLLVTLLLQCNDVSLNPGPPVKLSVENFTCSRGLKMAHLNVRSLMPKWDSATVFEEERIRKYFKSLIKKVIFTIRSKLKAIIALFRRARHCVALFGNE